MTGKTTVTDFGPKLKSEAKHPTGLTLLFTPDPGQELREIPLSSHLRLGRTGGENADVSLPDQSMSRLHATFVRHGDDVYAVRDNESKNGTFVNGVRVGTHYIEPGSILRLGGTIAYLGPLVPSPNRPPRANDLPYGISPALRAAVEEMVRVAPTPMSVLIEGESGTGKELAARRIHLESGCEGRFVAVNCGAIAPNLVESTLFGHVKGAFTGAHTDRQGVFQAASSGTLFLDEIGELPIEMQPKLLRVLENREFSPVGSSRTLHSTARIVAATNVDVDARVEEGAFRLDLLARLRTVRIAMPPLRERRLDILPLAEFFLNELAQRRPIEWTPDFAEALLLHSWPMNVRELRSLMQRLTLFDESPLRLLVHRLPEALQAPFLERSGSSRESVSDSRSTQGLFPDKEDLEEVLARCGGNVAKVAEHYGKARKQVYRWLRRHELDADSYR